MKLNNAQNANQTDGRIIVDPVIAKAAREVLSRKGISLSSYIEARLYKIVLDDRRARNDAYFSATSLRREVRSKLCLVFDNVPPSEDQRVKQARNIAAEALFLKRDSVKDMLEAITEAKETLADMPGYEGLERLEAHLQKKVVSAWAKICDVGAFSVSASAAAEGIDAVISEGSNGWHARCASPGLETEDYPTNSARSCDHRPARQRAVAAKEYFYLNWFEAE